MFIELAVGAFLLEEFIRHKITDEKSGGPRPDIPRVDEGTSVSMLFGKYRVRSPILVWKGPFSYNDDRLDMDVFFVLGLGFQYGLVRNRIHRIWASDVELTPATAIAELTGNGLFEDLAFVTMPRGTPSTTGFVEFLNGSPAQALVDGAGAAATYTAEKMINAGLSGLNIPAYRHVLSVALLQDGGAVVGFCHGNGSNGGALPAYQFEASSFYEADGSQPTGLFGVIGQDANPVSVIYDVLTATIGKLGLSSSLIDLASFEAAAYTLYTESHGYSRCFEQYTTASEIIYDVLRQIDGVLFQDPTSGLIKIKLIRNDYDPATLATINKANGHKLQSFAFGGRTNLVNKVVVKFPNRALEYTEDSRSAQNLANAVGQDGQTAEEVLEYLGCCYGELAVRLAERELYARSRPVLKCRAIVDRSFVNVRIGDPLKLVWNNPDVSGAIMRVVGVQHGTLENGAIALDLVSDASYVWRNQTPKAGDFGGIPRDDIVLGLG